MDPTDAWVLATPGRNVIGEQAKTAMSSAKTVRSLFGKAAMRDKGLGLFLVLPDRELDPTAQVGGRDEFRRRPELAVPIKNRPWPLQWPIVVRKSSPI